MDLLSTTGEQWKKNIERDFLDAYEREADALFRHCMLRLRDRELARDVVQESFCRTWTYLSQGKEIAYLRAFLFRVANNLIVDASRKRRHASLEKMAEEDGFEPADETVPDPARLPQLREAMAHLENLEEIYRTAITMRFFRDMSPREIAYELGVSENVVSVRIHRGIRHLSRLMQRDFAGADGRA